MPRACAANPVAVVMPCHRVIRGDGRPGGYRWGVERKRVLLVRERQGPALRAEGSPTSRYRTKTSGARGKE